MMTDHPKIQELLGKTRSIRGIGPMIQNALNEVIKPNEKVLACYYALEQAERKITDTGQKVFYSCMVYIVTNQTFVTLGFYPKFHRYSITRIHQLNDLIVEYRSPSKEELQFIPEVEYIPESIHMKAVFGDEQGKPVAEWEIDTAGKGLSNELMESIKALTPLVGVKLS